MDRQPKIEKEKEDIINHYAINWNKMINEWNLDDDDDAFWLTFSASYLFKTGGIRWALDPVSLFHRLNIEEKKIIYKHNSNIMEDFKKLSFVVLSHNHPDHYDIQIINELALLPIKIIIPDDLFNIILKDTKVSKKKLIVLKDNESINIEGIEIKSFDGFHDRYESKLPSNSYFINTDEYSMFFPGDVRQYDANLPTNIPSVDFWFAHLWLGSKQALLEKFELLESFCEFNAQLNPRKIFITHLFEVARLNYDYWNQRHANIAKKYFNNNYNNINVDIPPLTTRIKLSNTKDKEINR